jgi:hypothetical protein
MILDMIQGCRYLRRSTDRWLLSKNSTTQLKDSKGWRKAGLLWNCSIPITDIKGLYLYRCPNTTPDRLGVQHLIPKLMLWCQCPSRTRHQFVPSLYLGHVIKYSRKLPLSSAKQSICRMMAYCRPQAFLPNPLRRFPAEWHFVTKLGPQVSPFLVPIFGVNIFPFNYGIKVILFWNWPQILGITNWIGSTPVLSSLKPLEYCWRWKSVNLAMSLPSVLAWLLYLIHWY